MNLVDTVVKSCEALEGLLRRFDPFHYFYNFDIIFILQKKIKNKIMQKSCCHKKKQKAEFHNEKNFLPKIYKNYMKIINVEILNSEL